MTPKPESETDPWIGWHRSHCWRLSGGLECDCGFDAARAAEAAQRRQEKDAIVADFTQAMWKAEGLLHARLAAVEAERDKAVAEVCAFSREQGIEAAREITLLTAERDRLKAALEERDDAVAGLRMHRDELRASLAALKAVAARVADALAASARLGAHKDSPEGNRVITWSDTFARQVEAELRAALTPQGQSTDGETR